MWVSCNKHILDQKLTFFKKVLLLLVLLLLRVCVCLYIMQLKGQLKRVCFFFHHVGPEDRIQGLSLGDRQFYPLCILIGMFDPVYSRLSPASYYFLAVGSPFFFLLPSHLQYDLLTFCHA